MLVCANVLVSHAANVTFVPFSQCFKRLSKLERNSFGVMVPWSTRHAGASEREPPRSINMARGRKRKVTLHVASPCDANSNERYNIPHDETMISVSRRRRVGSITFCCKISVHLEPTQSAMPWFQTAPIQNGSRQGRKTVPKKNVSDLRAAFASKAGRGPIILDLFSGSGRIGQCAEAMGFGSLSLDILQGWDLTDVGMKEELILRIRRGDVCHNCT